ncbi:hypothetical protein IFR05_014432 [Cadophora sp. M221]|nr:hypothetical protein IFR05_014432 [Cadophora sp. M221]
MLFKVIIASLWALPVIRAATHFLKPDPTGSINVFTERQYGGDHGTYYFGDNCIDIEKPFRHNIGSIDLGGFDVYGCRFFADDGCTGELLLYLEEGSYSHVGEWGHQAASFQCVFGDELLSLHSKHHTSQGRLSALKAKTAEVILYNEPSMQGVSKNFTVSSKECNEIKAPFVHAVHSMTIDVKIWYCIFYVESGCKGKDPIELGSGVHEDLFGSGLDMESFQCVLFKRTPRRIFSLG